MTFQPQVIKDADGNDIGVFLPKKDYDEIMEMLEEYEDIRDYEIAKALDEETIPLREAIRQRKKQGHE